MTIPKKQKLSAQSYRYNESEITAATALTRLSSLTRPPSSNHNLKDHPDPAFGEYKDLSLNATQQHEVTGKFHERIPLMHVHEIDSWLLESLAKQLETCIFPTAKMMGIDPNTVKRMLDNEFRKAYGMEVETAVLDPDIRHDGQRDVAIRIVKVGRQAGDQKETLEQSEHSSGDEGYDTVSSAATVYQNDMHIPEASKQQENRPQFGGKASNIIRRSKDHYHDSSATSVKQECADIRMISRQKHTPSGEPIKHPTTALMKKPDLHVRRHGNNVCFRNISESKKKGLRYQAKQHKQKCDSFVITLSSKVAAVRWQELECISPIHAYVEKIEE